MANFLNAKSLSSVSINDTMLRLLYAIRFLFTAYVKTALIEKGLDYMTPRLHIATASEWKRRGYRIRDSEDPVLKVKIWKPIKEHGMILVDAHFYDVTQIE